MADTIIEGGHNSFAVDPLRFWLVQANRPDDADDRLAPRCQGVLKDAVRLLAKFPLGEDVAVGEYAFLETPEMEYRTPEQFVGLISLHGTGIARTARPLELDLATTEVFLTGRPSGGHQYRRLLTLSGDGIVADWTGEGGKPGQHQDLNYLQNLLPKIEKAAFPPAPKPRV